MICYKDYVLCDLEFKKLLLKMIPDLFESFNDL